MLEKSTPTSRGEINAVRMSVSKAYLLISMQASIYLHSFVSRSTFLFMYTGFSFFHFYLFFCRLLIFIYQIGLCFMFLHRTVEKQNFMAKKTWETCNILMWFQRDFVFTYLLNKLLFNFFIDMTNTKLSNLYFWQYLKYSAYLWN